jgi:hypothetical protein
MFRGGSTNMNGIMSGIEDRKKYDVGGSARERLTKVAAEYPSQAIDPLGQFLIQGGLNLLSGTGAGKGTLGALAESYKEPTTNLFKSMSEKNQLEKKLALEGEVLDIETENALRLATEKAKGDSKTYKDILVGEEISRLVPRIGELTTILENKDGTLSEADKVRYRNELDTAKINLNRYKKDDPTKVALLDIFTKSTQGEYILNNNINALFNSDPQKYGNDKKNPKLLMEAIRETEKFLTQMLSTRINEAEGGRIGYALGTPEPQVQPELNEQPISYEQLRARLPKEIGNDIVTLMANSASALEDFASIQSQQDVDNFNTRYGVNLVLPTGA